MIWQEYYDDKSVEQDFDKYKQPLLRGYKVIWASVDKPSNRPYLNEGIIIGFTKSPSFTNIIIKTNKNHIVKHLGCALISIQNISQND